MQQKNYTRGAVEEYREVRREEKRVHKKEKRDYDKQELIGLQSLTSSNAIRAYYQKLNERRKGFQPRTTLCRANEGMILWVAMKQYWKDGHNTLRNYYMVTLLNAYKTLLRYRNKEILKRKNQYRLQMK
jgi:hypothetical protein